jgi:hypothetical protein
MAHPIESQIVLLTSAKASVAPQRLPELIEGVQEELGPRLDEYRHRYERVHESADYCAFFAEAGHWETVGERLGFSRRETDAVRRAHEEQLLRTGRRENRREEFESALDIREAVVVGIE